MNAPKITDTVSFGNILTIAVLLGSIAAAYGFHRASVAGIEARVSRVESEMREKETRMRALENGSTRIDERLAAMAASIKRIEDAIIGAEQRR